MWPVRPEHRLGAPDWPDLAEAAIPPGAPITHARVISRLISPRRRPTSRPVAGTTIAGSTVAGCAAALAASLVALLVTNAMAAPAASQWQLKLATRYLPPATNRSQYVTVLVEGGASWFFGGSNVGAKPGTRVGAPRAERRQNGRWHSSALPAGLHSWIAGASATSASDIWAVTALNGKVVNWNGGRWTVVPRGGWGTKGRFTAIIALSHRNVWLFGAKGVRRPGAGTWHLSGATWTHVRGVATNIDKASAAAPVIWAIGGESESSLLEFRHGRWRKVAPAALAGFTYSDVLALGRSSIWVAGSVAGLPELGHFDGHRWSALTMPGSVPATGLCRDGKGGLWAIANPGFGPSGVLDRSATGHWTTAKVSSTSADELLACAHVTGKNATWGAGKAAAPQGTAAAAYGFGNTP